MIEITTNEAIGTALTIFSIGVAIGYRLSPRVHSSTKTQCNTPIINGIQNRSIAITKEIINGRCEDVSCVFIQDKQVCEITDRKCKLIKTIF